MKIKLAIAIALTAFSAFSQPLKSTAYTTNGQAAADAHVLSLVGAGSQTPLVSDINGAGHAITNVTIKFKGSTANALVADNGTTIMNSSGVTFWHNGNTFFDSFGGLFSSDGTATAYSSAGDFIGKSFTGDGSGLTNVAASTFPNNVVTNGVSPSTGVLITHGTPSFTSGQALSLSDTFASYLANGFSSLTVYTNKITLFDNTFSGLTVSNGVISGNGSGLTGVPGSTLPGYVVTNGSVAPIFLNSNLASITLFVTNYAMSPLTVTGCVKYPFLNSTNWIFVASNSCWMEAGKSNYLFYEDKQAGAFAFLNINRTFDGLSGVLEVSSVNAILPVNRDGVFTDTNGSSDPIQIISTNIVSTSVTNIFIRNSQSDTVAPFGQVNSPQGDSFLPVFSEYNTLGDLIYQLQVENQGASIGSIIRMYGRSYGQTPGHKIPVLRLKGVDSVSLKQGISINGRMDAQMTNGAELSFDITAPGKYGDFNLVNPWYVNGKSHNLVGNITATYNPGPEGGDILDVIGFLTVAPSTVGDPQFILQGSPPYTGSVTNGMFYSDGTNVWVAQNGVLGKLATSASSINLPSDLGTNTTQEGARIYGNAGRTNWTDFTSLADSRTNTGSGNSEVINGTGYAVNTSNLVTQVKYGIAPTGAVWSVAGSGLTPYIALPTNGPVVSSVGFSILSGTFGGNGSGLTNLTAGNIVGTIGNNISGASVSINVGSGSYTGGGVTLDTTGILMTGGGNNLRLNNGSFVNAETVTNTLTVYGSILGTAEGLTNRQLLANLTPSTVVSSNQVALISALTPANAALLTGVAPQSALANVTNSLLNGGTIVGGLFVGTNANGKWVLGTPAGGTGGNANTNSAATQVFLPVQTFMSTVNMSNTLNVTGNIKAIANNILASDGTPLMYYQGSASFNTIFGGGGNETLSGTQDAVGGSFAANGITSASGCTIFGAIAANSITTAASETAIGSQVLRYNLIGAQNTGVGNQALLNCVGSYNTAVGASALSGWTNDPANAGGFNCAFGISSMPVLLSGLWNTAYGSHTMLANVVGNYNVAMGVNAMFSSTNSYDTSIGTYSLSASLGQGNVALGYQSGVTLIQGDYNIYIGDNDAGYSGPTNTTEDIMIGHNIGPLVPFGTGQYLDIGNLIFGTGLASSGTLSSGKIGIGTTNPVTTLQVSGTVTATGFSGNGSGLTNIGNFYLVSTNSTQLTITNSQNCRGVFTVNLAFDDVTGGNPSCTVWETNSVFTNFFGTISPNLSGLTLVGTVSVTNFYSFPAQTNSTLTIVDTSSGGAAVRKIVGNVWY